MVADYVIVMGYDEHWAGSQEAGSVMACHPMQIFCSRVSEVYTGGATSVTGSGVSSRSSAACGMDGINIDFENITAESGEHFIQFLRELSIRCRAAGLVLSVSALID